MRLPILMYHAVGDAPVGVKYPGNYVSRDNFAEQLGYLSDNGYKSIPLSSWLRFRSNGGTLPERVVVITFDDGYESVLSNAWPLLRDFGFAAATFVVTGYVGKTNEWDREEVSLPLLGASEIRELHREGMEFGSHTHTHRGITQLNDHDAIRELTESRSELCQIINAPVEVFAYPYSKFNGRASKLVGDAGYSAAVRGGGGLNSRRTNPLGLRRMKIDNSVSLDAFHKMLSEPLWRKLFKP